MPRTTSTKKTRKSLKVMARTIQLAVAAAQLALDDCGVDKSSSIPTRFGVEFGAGLIATELEELATPPRSAPTASRVPSIWRSGASRALPSIPPLWMLKYLPNMLACHVSILHNAQGPNNTITESDVASLLALGEAYRIIGRDQADFFLVGGADSKINPLSMVRQCLFEPLSHRNDCPGTGVPAVRPQPRRHGPGRRRRRVWCSKTGACRRRGARIYAELVGFGAAFDRDRPGQGLARAIRAALAEAGIGPEDVDHVNAHGLARDERRTPGKRGLAGSFGNCQPPVPCSRPRATSATWGPAAARPSWRPACWPCSTACCRPR